MSVFLCPGTDKHSKGLYKGISCKLSGNAIRGREALLMTISEEEDVVSEGEECSKGNSSVRSENSFKIMF